MPPTHPIGRQSSLLGSPKDTVYFAEEHHYLKKNTDGWARLHANPIRMQFVK